jgi:hypothetical protein
MYQETSAIGRRRNLLHEKPVDTVAGVAVGESEIQRPLYLPAELLRFSFCLPARRSAAGIVVVQSIHEVRIDEMWFPGTTAILFQMMIPYCKTNTRSLRTRTQRTISCLVILLMR